MGRLEAARAGRIGCVTAALLCGLFFVSSATAQCNQGVCKIDVTVTVTGSPCKSSDIAVKPPKLDTGKASNNIQWTITNNEQDDVRFPDSGAIVFKGTPEAPQSGVFGQPHVNKKKVDMDNKPVNDTKDHEYDYHVTVVVKGNSCTLDPTIANSGTHGPPLTKKQGPRRAQPAS
jgi:hypothetical protein